VAENAEHPALVAEFIHLGIKQKISPRGARFFCREQSTTVFDKFSLVNHRSCRKRDGAVSKFVYFRLKISADGKVAQSNIKPPHAV
jgi:hypothetical protein